jgi:DNA-binding ferritin-like protein
MEKPCPRWAVANNVERSAEGTMYNMRGYTLPKMKALLALAKIGLEDLKKYPSEEQMSAFTEQLTQMAQILKGLIAQFKVRDSEGTAKKLMNIAAVDGEGEVFEKNMGG